MVRIFMLRNRHIFYNWNWYFLNRYADFSPRASIAEEFLRSTLLLLLLCLLSILSNCPQLSCLKRNAIYVFLRWKLFSSLCNSNCLVWKIFQMSCFIKISFKGFFTMSDLILLSLFKNELLFFWISRFWK